MKGQYLAVESVLTVGMGLSLAIGVVAVFGTYQDEVSQTTRDKEIKTVNYRMQNAIYELRNADSGSAEIQLPERVGGVQYRVALDDGIRIITPEEDYTHSLNNLDQMQLQGSASGGEVILYKSENQYSLRSS